MRFTSQLGVSALLVSQALAHPKAPSTARGALHRRKIDLNAFRLKTIPEYSNATVTETSGFAASFHKRADYLDAATDLVQNVVPGAEFRLVDDHYVGTNQIAHAHFKQTVHGLDIDNADFNVNVSKSPLFRHATNII